MLLWAHSRDIRKSHLALGALMISRSWFSQLSFIVSYYVLGALLSTLSIVPHFHLLRTP